MTYTQITDHDNPFQVVSSKCDAKTNWAYKMLNGMIQSDYEFREYFIRLSDSSKNALFEVMKAYA